MNQLLYFGLPLLEGPQNFFRLSAGVMPSFGFFRMSTEDVETVLVTQGGGPGALTFDDGVHLTILSNIYLVRSTSISSMDDSVCDIVLADERILWPYKYGTKDYNTYKTDRTIGTAEFELENLNSGNEWTFTNLRDELKSILGITTLNFLSPTRKPRNVIGKNVPGPCILQQFLVAAQAYLVVDFISSPPVYDVLPIGDAEETVDLTLLVQYAQHLHKSSTVRLNPKVQKGLTIKMLAAANPDDAPGRLLAYGSKTATGGSGSHFIPSTYAVFGNEENSVALGTVGDEVAQEYVDSFGNTWRDSTYAGVLPFKLNRAIHEITWQSNAQGAFTHIKSFRPREELTARDLQDTLFTYHKYLLGAGGASGTQVRRAKIQTGGVPANNTGPFTCKLLDAEGTETGNSISVYPVEHLGTNNFDSGNVQPNLVAADNISVFQDLNDTWYTTFTFEDTVDCVCTPP